MITYASVYIQRDATKRTNILASCGGFHCNMGCKTKNAKMKSDQLYVGCLAAAGCTCAGGSCALAAFVEFGLSAIEVGTFGFCLGPCEEHRAQPIPSNTSLCEITYTYIYIYIYIYI